VKYTCIIISGIEDSCIKCSDGSSCIYRWSFCDRYSDCDNNEDENEAICKGKRAVLPKQTCLRVRVMPIIEDHNVTVKYRTAIKAMYLYFKLWEI